MTDPQELDTSWSYLVADSKRNNGSLSWMPLQDGIVLAGTSNGNRYLLAKCGPDSDRTADTRGRVIQLQFRELDGDHYIGAVCVDSAFAELFTQLSAELTEDLVNSSDPATDLRTRLERWRQLFSAARDPLSLQGLAGLFGELTQLEALIRRHGAEVCSTWENSKNEIHDFRSASCVIEVKSSLSRTGRRISISSIEQLERPNNRDVYLRFYGLREDPAGDSVPGVIERLVEAGLSRVWLLEQLDERGYQAVHEGQYEESKFLIREDLLYSVDAAAFPKLTRESFNGGATPPGIASVSYTIDITNSPPEPLPPEVVAEVEDRMGVRP